MTLFLPRVLSTRRRNTSNGHDNHVSDYLLLLPSTGLRFDVSLDTFCRSIALHKTRQQLTQLPTLKNQRGIPRGFLFFRFTISIESSARSTYNSAGVVLCTELDP